MSAISGIDSEPRWARTSPMTPAAYGEFIRKEIAQYARVIQNAKIKLD